YGPHLLKLLQGVADRDLPPSWYMTATVIDLRHCTAAKAALTWCAYDFIVEHNYTHTTFTPRSTRLKQIEAAWSKLPHLTGVIAKLSPSRTMMLDIDPGFRELSTKDLRRYLGKIDSQTASQNLSFYDEFQKCASREIDPQLLPPGRSCSVGFPY